MTRAASFGTLLLFSTLSPGLQTQSNKETFGNGIVEVEALQQEKAAGPHWASFDIVRRIYKCCKVYGVDYTQLYKHENNVPTKLGIELLTFSIETDTIGYLHLLVQVYSDPALMKDSLSLSLELPMSTSMDIAEIK